MYGLFEISPAAALPETPSGGLGPRAFIPRDYQMEDIAAVQRAWADGKRAVLYRAATGLGKAACLATVAAIHRADERTICLIDTIKLANQLRDTFARQLGWQPGLVGGGVFDGQDRRVVICVQQSLQIRKGDGPTRAERIFDPSTFGTMLLDETESAFADGYSSIVRYFLNGNPDLHCLGVTATPIRGDGIGMGAIFDHVVEEEGPLNRGPLWAFQNGWLVPPRQAFIKCSVDFSTLKLRGKKGEQDYTDDQVAELISSEENLVELAQGVIETAGDDRSIVFCPNSTDTSDKIADYLNAARPGCAMSVHAKLKNPDGIMDAHQRGEFQFLVSVSMLVKGYDDPKVMKGFILRPTKSQRMFQQIIGRVFRPHDSIARLLGETPTAEGRRALIANSVKPRATIFCLVGIKPDVRDMQIADLLNGKLTDAELQMVKQRMLDGITDGAAPEDGKDIGEVVKEVRKTIRDEREAENRRRVEVNKSIVQITELDDGQSTGNTAHQKKGPYEVLRRMGFKDYELNALNPEQAGHEAQRWLARTKAKPPLCSKGQWRVLIRRGHSAEQLQVMSKVDATAAIEEISKRERWGEKR